MITQELTLKRVRYTPNLKGSRFESAHAALFSGGEVSSSTYSYLLSLAALFLRADDEALNRFGYRIVLQYTEREHDYQALKDLARTKELMPLLELLTTIENAESATSALPRFADLLFDAYKENFVLGEGITRTYRTKGQMNLRMFAAQNSNVVVVAPTSYGKSEMMIERARESLGMAICIVVPTKALIAQTKVALIRDQSIRFSATKILTHPDAYAGEGSFIAVMTQERLFRLLQKNVNLTLDVLLIDEAHHLLSADDRNTLLSQVILSAQHRNPLLETNFYTPFVSRPESLTLVNQVRTARGVSSDEIVKIEKYFHTDLESATLFMYDQFLDSHIEVATDIPNTEVGFIAAFATDKNVHYLYRPRHAEEVAIALSDALPQANDGRISTATTAIAELIHPEYSLITALQHGVAFHHGRMPDLVRQYVEELYRDHEGIKHLVTTSTLLEGVNIPAETMFILDHRYGGGGHLTKAAFRNLSGRVARFPQIFSASRRDIRLLQPKIFLLDGEHSPSRANPRSFYKKVADVLTPFDDDVKNPLLVESELIAERRTLLEYLENVETGASSLPEARVALSEIGRLCFSHNVRDFDIFESETQLVQNLELYFDRDHPIDSVRLIVPAIAQLFFADIELVNADDLLRVKANVQAQDFYSMVLDWRCSGAPYKMMVGRFLSYWDGLDDDLIYVGSAWGDTTYGDMGHRLDWTRVGQKSPSQKANLAVAKVKEEQDFLDYRLMPYVDILNELGLVDEALYSRIQYGTEDKSLIVLLRNGISFELGRLLLRLYSDEIAIDHVEVSVSFSETLLDAMTQNGENEILVYEASCQF